MPYIYTRDELRRLLDSTACFPKYPRKLQADTLRAVLLLLYGAGLRVSEAVALTLEDVDLSTAVITIRDTKFNKTRLVPLGLELNRVTAQYAASRNKAGHVQTGSAPFFVLRRGGPGSIQSRHNQRFSRKASSLSSGRYRVGLTPSGTVCESAFSFRRRSAWRYIWVVSTDSCPSQSAITERSTPC